MKRELRCAICKKPIDLRFANNGRPLVRGCVCSDCNRQVIAARMLAVLKGEDDEKRKMG